MLLMLRMIWDAMRGIRWDADVRPPCQRTGSAGPAAPDPPPPPPTFPTPAPALKPTRGTRPGTTPEPPGPVRTKGDATPRPHGTLPGGMVVQPGLDSYRSLRAADRARLRWLVAEAFDVTYDRAAELLDGAAFTKDVR